MASLKQRNASRLNGARSRGPVTPEGKARVSRNATTHGIYSRTVVLNNENQALYLQSLDEHLAEWLPATETERNLVIDIVDARWRLRRYSALETAALDLEVDRMRPEIDENFQQIDEEIRTVIGLNALIANNRTFEVLQTAVRHQHRTIDRATRQLVLLRKLRPGLDDSPGSGTGPASFTAAPEADPAQQQAAATEICRNKPETESRPAAVHIWTSPTRPVERIRVAPVTPAVRQKDPDPHLRGQAAAA